jgi:hypothetical protein
MGQFIINFKAKNDLQSANQNRVTTQKRIDNVRKIKQQVKAH